MIVTRAVSEDSLNLDVTRQFSAQPKAIMMTGGVLAILLLIPGMPKIQLAVISLALMLGGYYLLRHMEEMAQPAKMAAAAAAQAAQAQAEEEADFKDINSVYSLISVEPIEMELSLIHI